ncbi:LysR family transcriptional regulator [Aestuariicella hydrocarbonica]|uniref:LysR family transcriptional regulator n=1 Tax=Pseudomaricurvus hydrocarbonicus TaxID=1470433 RepID=A0A9E5JZZ6_9GAMM|nr:LysR family transcriptional regulator [Aestuariicella hydrocarbonica]NHO65882.1 LysR family transcriptional regulator [Aestuariicella hydrocarbonica]
MTKALRNVSDSEIKLLSIFHRVVARGGLSAAELDLNIGRSTISRHLKDLEVRLGVTLCQRGSAGFALTREGKEIYQASIELFEAIHRFKLKANDIQENLSGVLKIGLCDKVMGNPNNHVAAALRSFVRSYPDIRIDIHTQQLNFVEAAVISGEYHLGVVPIHRETSSLEYESLFLESMSLYCGRDHVLFGNTSDIPIDTIRKMRFAAMDVNSPNQQIFERLELPRSAIAHEQEGIALLIQTGEYLGFLPDHYAKTFVQDGIMKVVHSDRCR